MSYIEELTRLQEEVRPQLTRQDHQMINDLKKDNLSDQALKTGSKAPNFEALAPIKQQGVGQRVNDFLLPDAMGKFKSLTELMDGKKSLVVNFYRGMWCPFCNLELKALQKLLPKFKESGSDIVAISPQSPDNTLTTVEKRGLDFTVLSDLKNDVAKQFGISFPVPDYLVKVYAGFGLELEQFYDTSKIELPLPATYVIDDTFTIRFAFVQEDFTERANVDDILSVVQEIEKAALPRLV